MTRAHIADPYIVEKITKNEEDRIRTCVGATYCSNHRLCIQNPATARERNLPHKIAKTPHQKKVVVVGGGPAGLEAARVCAERGHRVVLFEANKYLGGQVLLAAKVTWRKDILGIVEWLSNECELLGVDIQLNRYAEQTDILIEPGRRHFGHGRKPQYRMGSRRCSSTFNMGCFIREHKAGRFSLHSRSNR